MTSLTTIDFILLVAYFILLLVIGYFTHRKQKREDFLIAERKLGSFTTMATINASKTGSILMIFVGLVYLYGFAAIWYFIGMVVGILIFLPFGLRLKEYSKKEYYTMADYFKDKYGKKIAIVVSLITIFLMIGNLVLNLIAGTKIFTFFTNWPFWLCAIIMTVVVLFYLLMGGYKAVVKTDIIQYIAMFIIMILLTITLFKGSLIPASEWKLFNVSTGILISFFLAGILYPFAMPELWQRVYSSKNKKTFRNGILLSAGIYAFLGFLLGLIALTIKIQFPAVDPNIALIYGFQQLLPSGLLGLATILLFAAIMSSFDTYIYTGASAIVQDFSNLNKKKTVENIRKFIFILAVVATIITIAMQDLLTAAYLFASFMLALGIISMATWVKRTIKQRTLLIALIFGSICNLLGVIIFHFFLGGLTPAITLVGLISTIIGLLIGGIVSLIKKK